MNDEHRLPDLTDDIEGICPVCSEYPWTQDECAICGERDHDHAAITHHAFVSGDGVSPHPHDFRFPPASGEKEDK